MNDKQMTWFARFPHPDASKGMWIECDEMMALPADTIREYAKESNDSFTVRFERHRKGWANKFPEL